MTSAASVPDDEAMARLGSLIRARRAGRYTVQELAGLADVSIGLLSQIERGHGNPSFRTLQKIAGALDLRIGDLVAAATPVEPSRNVVRRDARTRIQFGSEGLVYELLTPDLRGRLEMLHTTVPPGFDNEGHPFRHVGEECVLVLEGELVVEVEGVIHTLSTGDAITYDSGRPHWWQNPTAQPATIVGAVTPPSF
jgi:transcriptional regulator with XRE-family HTH domain